MILSSWKPFDTLFSRQTNPGIARLRDRRRSRKDILEALVPLHTVFHFLAKRLTDQTSGDAIPNSIVQLDSFALSISLSLDDIIKEYEEELDW